jgi:hypothetical protein
MKDTKLIITPKTKVGELLDSFPELEKVLMEMSPAFEKLKNPVLRRTVARVATLQQISVVGGLKVDQIVNALRKAAGQESSESGDAGSEFLSTSAPPWFDKNKITVKYDASPVINSGGSPMNEILSRAVLLESGKIFELTTPFVPAPIIEMLMKKGYKVYCVKPADYALSYITK